jgi:hypothetical protein
LGAFRWTKANGGQNGGQTHRYAKRIGSLHNGQTNRASSYDDGLPTILGSISGRFASSRYSKRIWGLSSSRGRGPATDASVGEPLN